MESDGWKRFWWNSRRAYDLTSRDSEPFCLPSSLPEWPKGKGFANGTICLGELEVVKVAKFESIWSYQPFKNKCKGSTFYKPVRIPDGFFCLGHHSQSTDQPSQGFVLAAREVANLDNVELSPLQRPIDYTLIWSSTNLQENYHNGSGFFWLPCPPEGYRALGIVVTKDSTKPSIEEVRCVRTDLTDQCEIHESILSIESNGLDIPFSVWKMRPSHRGIWCRGVSVGTFFCCTNDNFDGEMNISCLKNLDPFLNSMPNLDQIHALIRHYGPTVFFHPMEIYLPSSVSWFFRNGATLYKKGDKEGQVIDADGSNLPVGGDNDGEYWIDFPDNHLKHGSMDSAELYIHVKPALGGTFTDIVMWVFCPFNGPAKLKIGFLNVDLRRIGQHVGDWEHFTLRISNFTGELWSLYFSQHSGGEWVDSCSLEFIHGNRPIVYSSKSGHGSFPHPGTYLQGSKKLGVGIRNDAARSKLFVDSSLNYQVISAEYLGGTVSEPFWLQYMREWGPTIVYNSRSVLDKFFSFLPVNLRLLVKNIFDKLPAELFGEEGPTGPKKKDNWLRDERC